MSDVARHLDIAPSSAYRLLSMLVYRGFAVRDEKRAYLPGPSLGAEALRVPWARLVSATAQPHLEVLAGRTGETANLVFRVDATVRFLASVEGSRSPRVASRQGGVLPARTTSGGKVLLADSTDAQVRALYTSRVVSGEALTEADLAGLLDELAIVRQTGIAFNDEDTESGVCAVAVPIRRGERVAFAVSLAAPTARSAELREASTLRALSSTAVAIEVDLEALGTAAG